MQKLTATIEQLNANLMEKDLGSTVRAVILRRLKIKAFEPDWASVEVIKEPRLWLLMFETVAKEDVFGPFGGTGPLLRGWYENARAEWIGPVDDGGALQHLHSLRECFETLATLCFAVDPGDLLTRTRAPVREAYRLVQRLDEHQIQQT